MYPSHTIERSIRGHFFNFLRAPLFCIHRNSKNIVAKKFYIARIFIIDLYSIIQKLRTCIKEYLLPPLPRPFPFFSNYRQFLLFIVAFLIANNGIMMTMDFAGIIGAVLFNMTQTQLIVFMIIVQITSVAGAFVFGKLVDRVSTKRALILAILGMILACSLIFGAKSLLVFNLVGALAGFALTGVQSVSRTAVGQLAPEEKSAQVFGPFASFALS